MTHYEVFKSLVDNAFDFLRRSTTELGKHPKYSLIHFCAAVELFVKARLMREHWSLIVMKPESANWDSFCKGDFNSVGLKEADERLRNIAGDGLSPVEYASFSDLTKHRNKLIHFQHPKQMKINELRAEVTAEQLRAWFYLNKLLSERWGGHFKKIAPRLRRMEGEMKKNVEYLDAVYKALAGQIAVETQKGARYVPCMVCGNEAVHLANSFGDLHWGTCRVCQYQDARVEVPCPRCLTDIVFLREWGGRCSGCGREYRPEDLVGILFDRDEAAAAQRDGDDSMAIGNCSFCQTTGVLVPFHDQYLCVNCFAISENHWPCSWCHEFTNVRIGPSVVEGCFACSSSREEWMDKD